MCSEISTTRRTSPVGAAAEAQNGLASRRVYALSWVANTSTKEYAMAMKPTTFRFDERFLTLLDGLVQSMSSSRAAVIRQAVARYAMEYDLKYRGAQRFIERLRERYGDDKVISLVPDDGEDREGLEVLIDGHPTDEATGFDIEILKGRDQEGFWISEETEVYLHDLKADEVRAPINLILGTIPMGPERERRVGLSIRIGELRPEDVDFHTRPYRFDPDTDEATEDAEQAAALERIKGSG
jgi:hypothetical protein